MSQNLHGSPVVPSENIPQAQQNDDTEFIHMFSANNPPNTLTHIPSHISTHDIPAQQYTSYIDVPDEIYDRLSRSRKLIIVALLSYCGFLAPVSSTTVLAAVPEVASTYHTTGTIINLSNALYMLFMGISPCFWGPLSQVYGRRTVCHTRIHHNILQLTL